MVFQCQFFSNTVKAIGCASAQAKSTYAPRFKCEYCCGIITLQVQAVIAPAKLKKNRPSGFSRSRPPCRSCLGIGNTCLHLFFYCKVRFRHERTLNIFRTSLKWSEDILTGVIPTLANIRAFSYENPTCCLVYLPGHTSKASSTGSPYL